MISVCHVITRMILGGAQENTLHTVRGLHDDPEYDVRLVTGPALGPEGELLTRARELGLETIVIDDLRRNIHPGRDARAFGALRDHFANRDYRIVHTHSSKAGILGRWAARLENVPWIVHTIHGLPFHPYQSFHRNLLFRFLESVTGSFTHQIQTVCDRMAEKAQRAGVHPRRGYRTVYSGMELEPFLSVPDRGSDRYNQVRQNLGYEPDHFVFGKIARLFPLKGHRYCLRAFARVVDHRPEARLLLVGGGILRDSLAEQATELGIRGRVQFVGLVPYQEIPRMLTAMDALVHTSLREGLARVLPQAQAAGRAVISYDIDGAPEAITHRRSGLLVPPESVGSLAGALEEIMIDHELREKLVRNGRDWVTPRFDWKYMVEQIKSAYGEFLAGYDAEPQRDHREGSI